MGYYERNGYRMMAPGTKGNSSSKYRITGAGLWASSSYMNLGDLMYDAEFDTEAEAQNYMGQE